MLDIKKVYIDTRFKTPDSKSDSDFFIELPRSLNVPEDTICYLTDIVIPVSWSTVDARNNNLYLDIQITETFHRYHVLMLPSQNIMPCLLGRRIRWVVRNMYDPPPRRIKTNT